MPGIPACPASRSTACWASPLSLCPAVRPERSVLLMLPGTTSAAIFTARLRVRAVPLAPALQLPRPTADASLPPAPAALAPEPAKEQFYFLLELRLPPAASSCPTGSRGAHSVLTSLATVLQDSLRGCFPPPAFLQHPPAPPAAPSPPAPEAPLVGGTEPGGRAGQDGAARLGVRWPVQKPSFP